MPTREQMIKDFKRRATRLKKEKNIKHHQALNLLAREMGFKDYQQWLKSQLQR